MFTHGEEFLKVYLQTENSILEALKRKKSLKGVIFENNQIRNKALVFKLTIEVFKYERILSHVAREVFPMNCDSHLLKIGIYDLCIGEKSRNPNDLIILETQFSTTRNSTLLMTLRKRQECLNSIQRLVEQMKVGSVYDLVESTTSEVQIPKYIRINRHQNQVNEFLPSLRSKYGDVFRVDELMDFLLVFPHDFKTHKCSEVECGKLIVQDKASCLPPFVLYKAIEEYIIGEKRSVFGYPDRIKVIDTCAAPGNKTSLISEYFENDMQKLEKFVFAFEKNHQRFQLLKKNMRKYGVSNVLEFHEDFLKVDVSSPIFSDVRCALVDPSCTGSGIVNRVSVNVPGQTTETEYPKERIRKLSNFQAMVLQHAMNFPYVDIVVYSTCSIMEGENEGVVREVLAKRTDFTCVSVHNLLGQRSKGFGRIGLGGDFVAENVLRTVPEKDSTNGFFVAVLLKKSLLINSKRKRGDESRGGVVEEEEEEEKEEEEEEEEGSLEPPMKKRKLD